MPGTKVVHQKSHRLTPSITLHTFHTSEPLSFLWKHGNSLRMQLPADIDLTNNYLSSDSSSRQVLFTPCAFRKVSCSVHEIAAVNEAETHRKHVWQIEFLLRNGRLSTLIGTPRKPSLEAAVEHFASGSQDLEAIVRSDITNTAAIARGTGISPYLALSQTLDRLNEMKASFRVLLWSINYNDLMLVKYVLDARYLCLDQWSDVMIFVTSGTDSPKQSEQVLSARIEKLRSQLSIDHRQRLCFVCGRMSQEDLANAAINMKGSDEHYIFICGGKAFEWQIKRWSLSRKLCIKTIQQPSGVARKQ
jgi:hypothetical protein